MVRLIILFLVFIVMVALVMRFERKRSDESDRLLRNNIAFSGIISKIKISSSHNFGIIFLEQGDSVAFPQKARQGNTKFPYSIKDGVAEVYTQIPDGIRVGDSVSVISNNITIYYFNNKGDKKGEGNIYTIDNPIDLRYIAKNSNFK